MKLTIRKKSETNMSIVNCLENDNPSIKHGMVGRLYQFHGI